MRVQTGINSILKNVGGAVLFNNANPYFDTNTARAATKQREVVTAFNGTTSQTLLAPGEFAGTGAPYGKPVDFGNYLYAFPNANNSGILKVDLTTKTVSRIGAFTIGAVGAYIMPDGKIYSNIVSGQYICFDPQNETYEIKTADITSGSGMFYYNGQFWVRTSTVSSGIAPGQYRLRYSPGATSVTMYYGDYLYFYTFGSAGILNLRRLHLTTGAVSGNIISKLGGAAIAFSSYDNSVGREWSSSGSPDYGFAIFDFNTSTLTHDLASLLTNSVSIYNMMLGGKTWLSFHVRGSSGAGNVARIVYHSNTGSVLGDHRVVDANSNNGRYSTPHLAKNGLIYAFGDLTGGVNGLYEIDLKFSKNYMQIYSESLHV